MSQEEDESSAQPQAESQDCRSKKELALEAVAKNWRAFIDMDRDLRGDKDLVLAAVKKSGFALQHATKDLQHDKDVVLEAVKDSPHALMFGSEELRGDGDVILAAVKESNAYALSHASEELRSDRDLVLQVIEKSRDVFALEYANEALQADRQVVLEAVRRNGEALKHADKSLMSDREIVFAAVNQYGPAWRKASPDLQINQELLLLAARHLEMLDSVDRAREMKKLTIRGLQEHLVDLAIAVRGEDAPVVTISLTANPTPQLDGTDVWTFNADVVLLSGLNFVCTSTDRPGGERREPDIGELANKVVEKLRRECEMTDVKRVFITFKIGDNGDSIAVTPWQWDQPLFDFLRTPNPDHPTARRLRQERDELLLEMERSHFALMEASPELLAHRPSVLEIAKVNGGILEFAGGTMRADRDVVLAAVKSHGYALKHASNSLRADKEVVLEAVKKHGLALQHAPRTLRTDREVVFEAVRQNGEAMKYAGEHARGEADIVREAVRQRGSAWKYMSLPVETNEDILVFAARALSPNDCRYKYAEEYQAIMDQGVSADVIQSAIAVEGEIATRVSAAIYQTPQSDADEGVPAVFQCGVTFSDGESFFCDIPAQSATDQSEPILNDLATRIVEEAARRSQEPDCLQARRVFIFLHVNGQGVLAVTPSDYDRPLSDFL